MNNEKEKRIKQLELQLMQLRRKRKKIQENLDSTLEELCKLDPSNWECGYDPGY